MEGAKPQQPAWVGKAAGILIALICLAAGSGSLYKGIAPIREARYELDYHSPDWGIVFFGLDRLAFAKGGENVILTGAEGRRAGLALAAFGALFITWALVTLLTTFPPPATVRRWSVGLAAWAAANLAAVALLAFPPWKIGTMWSPGAFWGTAILLGGFLALAKTDAWKPWLGRIVAGLFVLGVAGGYLTAAIPAGIILAAFATLAGTVNAWFLIPSFRAKLQPLVDAARERLRAADAGHNRTDGANGAG